MKYKNLDLTQLNKVAETLALEMKNKPAVIGLSGDLGAGKTTFVKAFTKTLNIKTVKSPTFVISHRYPYKKAFVYHMDFYRLEDKEQLAPLGLDEILSSHNIVLIEWVEKFPQIEKKCDILINLKVKPDNKRDVTIKIPKYK
jgi:tRNA threonylcarbamoyladenosine biosynthesis protein TsaE